jgi:hypothetical protein
VKGGRASLSTEEPAKTSRWTEAVFLIIICLVACIIVTILKLFAATKLKPTIGAFVDEFVVRLVLGGMPSGLRVQPHAYWGGYLRHRPAST